MKLVGYNLRTAAIKKEIQRIWDETPVEKRPKTAQGIIAYKIASRYFNPTKEQTKYKEIYDFVFKLLV